MDEANGRLAGNPGDEFAQRVYNHCLVNTIELEKQINELKVQREWSEKVEMSDVPGNSNGFDSSDDAAIAFLKMYQGKSQEENKEYGVVIYESGGRYYLGQTHAGTEGSVTNIFWESVFTPSGLGNVIGTVHTHPEEFDVFGTDSRNNSFSGMDSLLPGIRYLGAPNGAVYRNDKVGEPNVIIYKGLPKSKTSTSKQIVYDNAKFIPELGRRIEIWFENIFK